MLHRYWGLADFGHVERNLRDMFLHLAAGRSRGETREIGGLTIASSGSAFQMFNTAFFNSPVTDQKDLESRISMAQVVFGARGVDWSFWVCEALVAEPLRRGLKRSFERAGLHLGTDMPAMAAAGLAANRIRESELEIRRVSNAATMQEFCHIGAVCFQVPLHWFAEVYDTHERLQNPMLGWIGYYRGAAVASVATVESEDAIGVYNLATLMPFRERGFGETILRHAVAEVGVKKQLVLQSTKQGLRLYQRLGFHAVSRILVFPSR